MPAISIKYNFTKSLILILILFFSGCTYNKSIVSKKNEVLKEDKTAAYVPVCTWEDSRYYDFIEAHISMNNGDIDKAVFFIKKAAGKDPSSLYLQRELAILYAIHGDMYNALSVVEKILKKKPDDLEALKIYGRIKLHFKDTEEAKKAYLKVLEIDPRQENIYTILGGLYMEEKDFAGAFKIYEKFVYNFPDSYIGHFFLGKIHAVQGSFKKAEKEFLLTLEIEPRLEEPKLTGIPFQLF